MRRYESRDLEPLSALIRDPSLSAEFDVLQGPHGVEAWIADPYRDPALHLMAWRDGEPLGFASPFVLPGREGRFAMVRLGVRGTARRHGVGSALLARTLQDLKQRHPDVGEVGLSAWLPSPEAEGFAARHRFERVRSFWLMDRRAAPVADPLWPEGIRLVSHDGSERRYADIAEAWNDSFSRHYHSIESTPDEIRTLFTRPGFRTDGYRLAYRGDRCVGFCRCELFPDRGEIAVLGTVEAARGIGLGRALLRWGTRWLEGERVNRVTLLVDGENEGALRLYRGEGFEVVRTRASWARTP